MCKHTDLVHTVGRYGAGDRRDSILDSGTYYATVPARTINAKEPLILEGGMTAT